MTAAPVMLSAAAASSAALSAASCRSRSSSSAAGIGTVSSTPVCGRDRWRSTAATSAAVCTMCGTGSPLDRT